MELRGRLTAAALGLALMAAACSSGDDEAAPGVAAASTTTDATTTTVEAARTTVAPVPSGECPPVPDRAAPDPARPRHVLDLRIDVADKVVSGALETQFTPDIATDRIVYRLWANGPRPAQGGASLMVANATIDGRPAELRQPSATLVEIPADLPAGREVTARVEFRLQVPGAINDRMASGDGWMRLGSFYPTFEWQPGVGWNTQPPTSGFAEASVAPTADFRVLVDAGGFDVLVSGTEVAPGEHVLHAARDVALTVGRLQDRTVLTADAGRPVEVVVAAHDGIADTSRFATKVVAVLEDFARRYGAYPWPRYTLGITPELSGGIEYPSHVLQGPGTIGRTTSHEVAHMWFYGLVGNHQGLHPWLDEGFATWAEAVFEGTVAKYRSTSIPAGGKGRAGQPMTFWESRQSIYYRGVYVQGAQALGALGDVAVVDCVLAHHVARNAHRIATPEDFAVIAESIVPGARAVLNRFGAGV